MSLTRQQYLFQCLQEEASEVAQAASKCIRFGPHEVYEDEARNPKRLDNARRLLNELIDLATITEMIDDPELNAGGVNLPSPYSPAFEEQRLLKQAKVERYMGYSRELGVVMSLSGELFGVDSTSTTPGHRLPDPSQHEGRA